MINLAYFQQNAKNTTQRGSLLRHQYFIQNDVYYKINDVTNVPAYSRLKLDCINLQATLRMLQKIASKNWCQFVSNLQRYDTIFAHVPKRLLQFASEKIRI